MNIDSSMKHQQQLINNDNDVKSKATKTKKRTDWETNCTPSSTANNTILYWHTMDDIASNTIGNNW